MQIKTRRRRPLKKKKKGTYREKKHKYKYLRGGLGDNDYKHINVTDTFRFQDGCTQIGGGGDHTTHDIKVKEFKKYVFGSEKHADLWVQILTLCHENKIPFYILTSGGKVNIIRTLQLLELDHLVDEVLCNNPNDHVNPLNTNPDLDVFSRNKFKTMSKYQIIKEIFRKCNDSGNGIFIDNDDINKDRHNLCSNVRFIHATGDNLDRYRVSSKFLTFVSNLSLEFKSPFSDLPSILYDNTNLVHTSHLLSIIDEIDSGRIDIVVSDFDGTMSPWRGALPFTNESFTERFKTHFNVKIE
jgi:hypothetical protein